MGARLSLVLLVAAAVACSRSAPQPPAVARRVVSLGPATTEVLFAVGAGAQVVGRSHYCDYPPEARALPDVGGMEPDVEAILGLHPDLVVGPSGAWSSKVAQTLGARGIATWFPPEIATLGGVDELILALGARTDHGAEARAVVAKVDASEKAIDHDVAGAPRPKALLVVGTSPVVAAGPGTFADDMLRRAGAVNVVAGPLPWPTLGFERLAELDPDVVIDASVAEGDGKTTITPTAPGWSGLRAVRAGRVLPLADERVLRPGPRVAEGLAALAHLLHPGQSR